ncbi:glycosyltransferase family 10 domain-containing protein [Sphingosinicella soli]|uniref:Fucosyltransferase C-terminal domain-containing protein n=1 Tax=Sphingosinicella soli TaxID=333708 RepID=A0A7W7AZZ6_9SPHN|nr:glycosyltransferase family 10 [Sphingosinicella soli]MBB4631498.1 hypothetical protein [Sphingosinicella soli]
MTRHAVFIDPSSDDFLEDRLFDATNSRLNRDGTLLPFIRLRERLNEQGIPVHTADRLGQARYMGEVNHYWSFGRLSAYQALSARPDVRLRGFILLEPPLVLPQMYEKLPELTRRFEEVHVHNVLGDGYSLAGVDCGRLRKLYWPQPYNTVASSWERDDRLNRAVVISGNHNPLWRRPEYYSKRIEAVSALNRYNAVDLYGRGWDCKWGRQSMWLPYWRHYRAITRAYQGSCESKTEVLSRYRFSLCLENMPMTGYVTEKIFDCLYAGVVPLYLGAHDIAQLVGSGAYIDVSAYPSWDALWLAIQKMPEDRWNAYRAAGRDFIEGPGFMAYYHSLERMVQVDLELER